MCQSRAKPGLYFLQTPSLSSNHFATQSRRIPGPQPPLIAENHGLVSPSSLQEPQGLRGPEHLCQLGPEGEGDSEALLVTGK